MRRFSWMLGLLGGAVVLAFLAYAFFVDTIQTPYAVTGGVGVLLVATWLWLDWDSLARAASARGARYTWTSIAMVTLGLAIAVAINVIAERYDKRWDVTSSQRFALSDQSVKVVAGLDQEVQILGFFMAGSAEESQFDDLMDSYGQHTTLLKVEKHDPMRSPVVAEQHNITNQWGTIVLALGDDTQRLESDYGEEAFTNALVRLTSGKEHIVCATQGHGELDPDDDGQGAGIGAAIVKLEGQNYKVTKLQLIAQGGVPDTCDIVLTADPQVDFLPAERELLAAYVASGGSWFLMLDPTHAPSLAVDMGRYGIEIGDDIVLEQNPNYQLLGGDASYILLDNSSFDLHPITEPIKGGVLLRIARTVGKGAETEGIQVQELARTTEFAWAESTLDGTTMPAPDMGQDRIGKVPLIAVAEITDPAAIVVGSRALGAGSESLGNLLKSPGTEGALPSLPSGEPADADGAPDAEAAPADADAAETPEPPQAAASAGGDIVRKAGGRVVVFGDSDFATNELLDQVSNQDLFLNVLAWLAGEENQISIRPNEASKGSLTLGLLEGLLLALVSLLILPGLAVAGAIGTWLRRRRL